MSQIFITPLPIDPAGPGDLNPPAPLFLTDTPPSSTQFRNRVRPNFSPSRNIVARRDRENVPLNDLTALNLPPTGSFVIWQITTVSGSTEFHTSEPLATPQTIIRLQITRPPDSPITLFNFALTSTPITTTAQFDALHKFLQLGGENQAPQQPLATVSTTTWENRLDIPLNIPMPSPPANRIVVSVATPGAPTNQAIQMILTLRPGL